MLTQIVHPSLVAEFVAKWERGEVGDQQFGAELKLLRRRLRIPLKELAQVAELTMATLSNLERNVRPARIDSIEKIFVGLRVIERRRHEVTT